MKENHCVRDIVRYLDERMCTCVKMTQNANHHCNWKA